MGHNPLWRYLGVSVLLILSLLGCAGTMQDVRQEIQDDRRAAKQKMAQTEKAYEKNEYLGFTSKDSEKWNATDWSMWMDANGGGR